MDTSSSPITISFALGPDVTVNTIFGLPLLHNLDPVIDLRSNTLLSRSLNCTFPITRRGVTHGFPPDCTLDPATVALSCVSSSALSSHPAPPSSFRYVLAMATDDHSDGFLRHSVTPCRIDPRSIFTPSAALSSLLPLQLLIPLPPALPLLYLAPLLLQPPLLSPTSSLSKFLLNFGAQN
jgi:hypothetical protein